MENDASRFAQGGFWVDWLEWQMKSFDHLVCIDESSRELTVYRMNSDGKRTLFARSPLPDGSGWTDELKTFASMLGENLLIDSPSARAVLGI